MRHRSSLLLSVGLIGVFLLIPASEARAGWSSSSTVNVSVCAATGVQQGPVTCPDGTGGAIVAWYDSRGANDDIYVQRVNAAGVPQWTANGVALCTATGHQRLPVIVSDGTGGAILAWQDSRGGSYDIYAQRVDASGAPQWIANGVALCVAANAQQSVILCSDGWGGAIAAWQDFRPGSFTDLYAQRVSATGLPQWTTDGVVVCSATGDQTAAVSVPDGAGGAILAWQDGRTGSSIYLQRMSAAGVAQWTANGVMACNNANVQNYPAVAPDGAGGMIVTWEETRSSNLNIYAQRLSAAGVLQWTASGVVVCSATGSQGSPVACADGAGGAIVAWQDSRDGNKDIYTRRVDASGTAQWTANGVALCTATGDQVAQTIVADGVGGAIIGWQDPRGGTSDVYARRIDATGTPQWSANGVALCTATGAQQSPASCTDGSGGAIVAWQDPRSGVHDIYAQRVDRLGRLAGEEPVIVSVRDVAGDQGGQVRIKWNASPADTLPKLWIGAYGIWRRVTEGAAAMAVARGGRWAERGAATQVAPGIFRFRRDQAGVTYWEGVGEVAARGDAWYTFVAGTFQDSTGAANPYTAFMVEAYHAWVPGYWASQPDSGYSVDNLVPAVPAPFAGHYSGSATALHWGGNTEHDLASYRVHRGDSPGFVPGAGNLVVEKPDTGYVDVVAGSHYYKLCAVDAHGNLSGYALLTPQQAGDAPGPGAAVLWLSRPAPNPARGSAAMAFSLSREGEVRLGVYDVTGRRVRELVRGVRGTGEHAGRWDGRDGSGAPVSAGLYLVRLEAEGRTLSMRLTLLR
ncbi:MAG: hypothetical protein HZB25_12465 [Candidatus Eisenbacteria bacterium]|nr:hypothetical protein [Candidatus Eisenbacteria bacterium]